MEALKQNTQEAENEMKQIVEEMNKIEAQNKKE